LERSDARLEDELLLADGVKLVVVGAVAVLAGIAQALGDLVAAAAAQLLQLVAQLLQARGGHRRGTVGVSRSPSLLWLVFSRTRRCSWSRCSYLR
jgi:hypothetical protein